MESKKIQAKKAQGYRKDSPCCGNCTKFISKIEVIKEPWMTESFNKETELRCRVGGFAVTKRGWCPGHDFMKGE